MSISGGLDEPIYTGIDASASAPASFHASIAGRPYMLDMKLVESQSLPIIRQQGDNASEPGEQSLSPLDMWRRSGSSWVLGTGQTWYDVPESVRRRFRESTGIDVWTAGEISLLPDTSSILSAANDNLRLLASGDHLYCANGTELYWTTDGVTWTAANIAAGEVVGQVNSITTDGVYVYATFKVVIDTADVLVDFNLNGIHRTKIGATTSEHWSDTLATLVSHVKGRLMASYYGILWNVTAAGVAPTEIISKDSLLAGQSEDYLGWNGFAEGHNCIYVSYVSGDKSYIYRLTVKPDGTALDTPVLAGELPDGEIIRSLKGYLGVIMAGTDRGVRTNQANGVGDLETGALLETGAPVRDFEGQGPFVWFGWDNYSESMTGLGRADLQHFADPDAFAPAYASDLMAAAQGAVLSVVTWQDVRVFSVASVGVFKQSTNRVATGELKTGRSTDSLTGQKMWERLDVAVPTLPAGGAVSRYVEVDGITTTPSADLNKVGTVLTYVIGPLPGEYCEAVVTLTRGTDATLSPVVNRITLRSVPTPPRGEVYSLPLLLHELLLGVDGVEYALDVKREYEILKLYERDGSPVDIIFGAESFSGYIDNVVRLKGTLKFTNDSKIQCTCIVEVRRFDS